MEQIDKKTKKTLLAKAAQCRKFSAATQVSIEALQGRDVATLNGVSRPFRGKVP